MYNFLKRLVDIFVSLTGLIILLPIFLIIILLLSLTGDHEVFYLQERVGYKNKRFYIIKFATMIKNSHRIGTGEFTVANDPRLLPFGKFLRFTKLNELPQLLNILKGDMTLVGPRPLMPKGFARYSKEVQAVIYNITPGLTGIGSVVFRNETDLVSKTTDYEGLFKKINAHKGKLELWYQENRSLKTDVTILFLTAYSIVAPEQRYTYEVFKDLPLLEEEEDSIVTLHPPLKRKESRERVELNVQQF